MKFLDLITVNKYYRMNNNELEREAAKFNIQGYGNSQGSIERERIIDQLLKKDNANNSRYAILISVLALLISIFAFIANR